MHETVEIPVTKNRIKPGFCCFGVIDDCMLRCKMCQKWQEDPGLKGKTRASLDNWKRAAKSLRGIVDEGFEIDIGGGEALLMKELWELVSYCADLGFKMAVASNGYLVDKDMAKRIANSGLHSLILSLDSVKPETHDFFRGTTGVYERVMKAIEYLHKYSPKLHIGICTIMMDKNQDDILKLARWVNDDGRMKSILFMAAMQPNNTPVDPKWYSGEFDYYWPKDINKMVMIIDELIQMRKSGYLIGNSIPQLEAFKSYYQFPDKFVKKNPCNMDKGVHVSSIGDIFLCYRWQRLGNIKENDLATAWYSEESEKARKNIRNCKDNCHFLLNCYFEGDYPFEVREIENKT